MTTWEDLELELIEVMVISYESGDSGGNGK